MTAGRTAAPFRMVVEEGKVREFAAATHTSWAGPPEPSPVTFLASSALWMRPENSAWYGIDRDLRAVLHGQQEVEFVAGPPLVGAVLIATQRIDRAYDKVGSRGAMTFTELVTDFVAEASGALVASMRSTSIRLHEVGGSGERPAEPRPAASPASSGPARPGRSDEQLLGEAVEDPLTVTDFVRYQGASGDFNPIHHDTEFARSAGYPGPFAVGMLTAGVAAGYAVRHRPIGMLRSFRARWKAQAWPGEALTYRVLAAPSGSDGRDTLRVEAVQPGGAVHLEAWASFDRG